MGAARIMGAAVLMTAASASACLAGEAEETTDARAVLTADGTPGDPDYGEYLAQECTTCHSEDGAAGGVPPIEGIEPGYFREAMAEYLSGERENAAMASVARSLGDEELAALAAWFALQLEQD